MNKLVNKFGFGTDTLKTFAIPKMAKIISVQWDGTQPALWAQFSAMAPTIDRTFRIIMDGESRTFKQLTYVGTFMSGTVASHVFEIDKPKHNNSSA